MNKGKIHSDSNEPSVNASTFTYSTPDELAVKGAHKPRISVDVVSIVSWPRLLFPPTRRYTSMSADLQKGERYVNFDFLCVCWISLDTTFRVKRLTGSTLASSDIEVDDNEMPALIPDYSYYPFWTRNPLLIMSKL
ncbi:hypothetical protein B0H16DRAFT_1727270 [Mycena metata]|uniref:Uncharacterized protein n=1 Tax=Mycena metata TaxID=1033252 RepID=A0AAD7IJ51_9AGAR|nr:hypothetical protein B0H16DRAFT_1727270 [Mycena metata]